MTAAQPATSADPVTQTLLETGWDVAPGFLSDLQRGGQDKWLHATCYDTLRVVYLDEQTQMWISVQYAQKMRDLWIETQIGQPSSRIIENYHIMKDEDRSSS